MQTITHPTLTWSLGRDYKAISCQSRSYGEIAVRGARLHSMKSTLPDHDIRITSIMGLPTIAIFATASRRRPGMPATLLWNLTSPKTTAVGPSEDTGGFRSVPSGEGDLTIRRQQRRRAFAAMPWSETETRIALPRRTNRMLSRRN